MSESEFDPEHDELLRRVADELRRPVSPGAGFDARLMARVRAEPAPTPATSAWGVGARLRAAARWLVQPRSIELSPLAGLAGAAAVVGLLVLGADESGRGRTEADGVSGEPTLAVERSDSSALVRPRPPSSALPVQFVVAIPQARRVTLVGDFNDWNAEATPLRPVPGRPGVWTVEVPLDAGRHEYAFVVDGSRWMPDPAAPAAVADDFGTPNSVITVSERVS